MPPTAVIPLPVEVLALICTVLSAGGKNRVLATLMRVSPQLYDIASPILYRKARLTEVNIASFLLGLEKRLKTGIKFRAPKKRRVAPPVRAQIYRSNEARAKRKTQLLSHVTHIEIRDDVVLESRQARAGQLSRYLSMLRWTLERAFPPPAELLLFPSLRQIDYTETSLLTISIPPGGGRTTPIYHQVPLVILLRPSSITAQLPSSSILWDVELRYELGSRSMWSRMEVRAELHRCLLEISTRRSLHDLILHTSNYSLCLLGGLCPRGSTKLHCSYVVRRSEQETPDSAKYVIYTEVAKYVEHVGGAITSPFVKRLEGRIEVHTYNALVSSPAWPAATAEAVRMSVYDRLQRAIGIGRIDQAQSERGRVLVVKGDA